jgi:hypothetical protein
MTSDVLANPYFGFLAFSSEKISSWKLKEKRHFGILKLNLKRQKFEVGIIKNHTKVEKA